MTERLRYRLPDLQDTDAMALSLAVSLGIEHCRDMIAECHGLPEAQREWREKLARIQDAVSRCRAEPIPAPYHRPPPPTMEPLGAVAARVVSRLRSTDAALEDVGAYRTTGVLPFPGGRDAG